MLGSSSFGSRGDGGLEPRTRSPFIHSRSAVNPLIVTSQALLLTFLPLNHNISWVEPFVLSSCCHFVVQITHTKNGPPGGPEKPLRPHFRPFFAPSRIRMFMFRASPRRLARARAPTTRVLADRGRRRSDSDDGPNGAPSAQTKCLYPVQILTRSRFVFIRRASPSTDGRSDAMKKGKDQLLVWRMIIVAMLWNLAEDR